MLNRILPDIATPNHTRCLLSELVHRLSHGSIISMVFNQVLIQIYFTHEDLFYMLYMTFIRDAPGISEKDAIGDNLQR